MKQLTNGVMVPFSNIGSNSLPCIPQNISMGLLYGRIRGTLARYVDKICIVIRLAIGIHPATMTLFATEMEDSDYHSCG